MFSGANSRSLFTAGNTLLLALLVYLSALFFNSGFMGTDEYWTGITRYVPAQTQTYSNMLREDDVKSPTQMIPFVWSSHRAFDLGLKAPYQQYRFVHIFLGILALLVLFGSLQHYIPENKRVWTYLVFTFYFAAPFAFTRAMYESLSAPFLLLSALSLQRYLNSKKLKDILISTLTVSLAFAFRPQAGIAALAIPIFLCFYKDWRAFFLSSLLGVSLFVLLGIPDAILRGGWHHSLKAILFYNVQYGASYAQQPWFFYILLSFVVLWGPFWISKRFPAVFKTHFQEQKVFWTYIVLVLGLHSFFPQKWERFIIPVLPLMILILADWIQAFWNQGSRLRIYALLGINLSLWIPSSFFPAQKNIIELSLYLDQTPQVQTLYRVNKNPEWITEAFIRRKDWKWEDTSTLPATLKCEERIVMNQKDFESSDLSQWELERVFETNALEKLAYKFNPSKNLRRTPLYLLKSKGC